MYTFEAGPSNQPALVFLHGGGLSSKMWQPVMERLPEFHCLAPDLPEHGQNRDLALFDLDDSARRIIDEVRQRIPGQKVHLIGLSLGGAVALDMIRLAPDLVDRSMVTGTSARLSKFLGWVSLSSLWMLRLYKPEKLVQMSAKQWGIPAEYSGIFHDDLIHSLSEDFNRRLMETLMNQQLPDAVQTPLLITVGEKETIPAKQAAHKLAQRYPNATARLVRGLGHVWALQNADLFAQVVRAWVQDTPLPADLIAF